MANKAIFRLTAPLTLASASPRRQDFLRDLGIPCAMVPPPEGSEPAPLPGEDPRFFAARAARLKAEAVYDDLCLERVRMGERPSPGAVLGADTVVFAGDVLLGKPRDPEENLAFLKRLVGREHRVVTACHLHAGTGVGVSFHGEATVRMGRWPRDVLEAYAACGEGLDKAGGYAVQGRGAFLVEAVSGSWSAVVGLPVPETVAVLLERDIIAPWRDGECPD